MNTWIRRDSYIAALVLVTAICGLGATAVLLGADGNYDMRNYHFYIGWALFHKPVGYDVAPAQVQNYLHPLLDGLFYQLWRVLNHAPLALTFVWSIPQAFAVWLIYLIACEVLGPAGRDRTMLAFVAALIAATGATSVSVAGTSMSEALPDALMLWGVLLVLRDFRLGHTAIRIGFSGLLAGSAVGLKLTAASYLVGFAVATLLTPGLGAPAPRLSRILAFIGGAFVGLAIIGGPWWWALYAKFGNPLFPYYNAIFHSPDYGNWNFFDDRFLPRTPLQWVLYPMEWAFRPSTLVSERPVRDTRVGLAVIGTLVVLACRVLRRSDVSVLDSRKPTPAATWCAIWTLTAYVLWLKVFSILRYAAALEAMSGVIIVAALNAVLPRRTPASLRVVATSVLGLIVMLTTIYPAWERQPSPGTTLLSVSVPQLPPDSLVILLVATPASYVAAFEPASVRFVGVYNSLIRLDSHFALQDKVEQLIRDAPGQIWGIDKTDGFFGMAEQSLQRYGLRRTADCRPIDSNVDTHLRMCRLERNG